MRSLFIVLISVGFVALAQEGHIGPLPIPTPASFITAQTEAGNSGPSAIEGQVRNALTGELVPRVYLLLRRADMSSNVAHLPTSYSASTDEHGRFVLKDIEPGKYRLAATRVGFVSAEFGSREVMGVGTILSIDPGQRLQDMIFRLTPHVVLTGRVVDEQGEPVPFVQVQAMGYRYNRGRKQLSSFGSGATNDLGEYRIFGLPPGRYYLSATYRSNAIFEVADRSGGQASDEDYVPTYYPHTNESASATPIEATAGAQLRGIDFVLSKSRTVHLRGRVSSTSKSMITVMLVPGGQTGVAGTNQTYTTDLQGHFDIRAAPGAYTFVASVLDANGPLIARQAVDLNANVENFNITIPPPLELAGQVRVEGDQRPNLSDIRISLRPKEPNVIFGPLPNARVKEDGTFTLSNISRDSYNVAVFEPPDGYYVKSVRMGDEDVLDGGISLIRESGGLITVTISPGVGQLEGAVVNVLEQAAPGVTVVLIPQEEKRRDQMQFYKTTTTDHQGRFTLTNLDPGRYKLFAWEDVESDAYMDAEFVKPVEDKGEPVTIVENSHERFQLRVIPAARGTHDESGKTAH